MTPGLLILMIFIATYRITRLVIEDTFPPIGVPREYLLNWWAPTVDWLDGHPYAKPHWGALGRSLRYLFTCPWCMSVWVGGGLVWVLTNWVDVPMPFLVWAGSSAATGLLANLEEFLSDAKR